MNKKITKFYFYGFFGEHKRCFCINIRDGEIIRVVQCESKERPKVIKNTGYTIKNLKHWKYIKECLKICLRDERQTFHEIYKNLRLDSKAYKIFKELIKERKEELKEEMDEIDAYSKILFYK